MYKDKQARFPFIDPHCDKELQNRNKTLQEKTSVLVLILNFLILAGNSFCSSVVLQWAELTLGFHPTAHHFSLSKNDLLIVVTGSQRCFFKKQLALLYTLCVLTEDISVF